MTAASEPAVLGDLVARERRSADPLVFAAASRPYTAHAFCTDAWKAANLFRYHGVGPGRPVAIADEPTVQSLLAFFGAALLGAPARFGFPPGEDDRLAVGPAAQVDSLSRPGLKRVAADGESTAPDVVQFGRDRWSENPTMPPDEPAPDARALLAGDAHTHADLLAAAGRAAAAADLTSDDSVALRASLANPGTVVGSVVAPLSVGASVVLPGADRTGTVAVADGDAPEERVLRPADAAP